MKVTTLEQLGDAIERVADEVKNVDVDLSSYLTKDDAANTYALKNQPVTLGTAAQTAEGAIWVSWN